MWMAASHPSSADTMAFRSDSDPATSSTPAASSSPALSGLRTRARTSSSRARSAPATAPPMNPVAPVRKTRISRAILSRSAGRQAHQALALAPQSLGQLDVGGGGAGADGARALVVAAGHLSPLLRARQVDDGLRAPPGRAQEGSAGC